jgi:hypothetical protein
LEALRVETKSRIGEAAGEVGQGHHARKCPGCPEKGAVSCGI